MNKCPACGKDIREGSCTCDQCGQPLDPAMPALTQPQNPAENGPRVKWFYRPASLIVLFLIVGPLMLPAVWLHPQYSPTKKMVITVIVVGLTFLLTVLTAKVIQSIWSSYGGMMPAT